MSTHHAPVQASQRAAEEQLVREHLSLVQHAVAEVVTRVPRHVSRDDLESAALFGLAQAARTFDPTRGIAFEHHAANRVRGALLDELRGADWASRSVRARGRQLQQTTDELTVRLRLPGAAGRRGAAAERRACWRQRAGPGGGGSLSTHDSDRIIQYEFVLNRPVHIELLGTGENRHPIGDETI